MSWLANTCSVMRREISLWLRSPGEIFFCGIVPLFWMLVIWGLLGNGVMTDVPVAFVDNDKSALSRHVRRAVDANRAFGLVEYESMAAAFADMRRGDVYAIVAVPFSYSRDMLSGRGASVYLYDDEARYAVAGTLKAEFAAIMSAMDNEELFAQALRIGDGTSGAARVASVIHSDFYALGNMEFSFLAFLGSALMPGLLMIGSMLAFVTAILRENWQNGSAAWLACAEGSFSAAIFGKLLPHFGLYAFLFLFYLALFCGYGGFAPAGSLFIWFAMGCCCLSCFAAMAILVTALAPNWRFALVLAAGYAAPALPFTGFSIPLESMGEYTRAFAHCLPLTWLIQGQAQQWSLGSPLANTGNVFLAFALLFILPLLPGLPLLQRKYARIAQMEEHKKP